MQQKYRSKVKFCCMDTDSLVYEKMKKGFYRDTEKDVETRFDTSRYSKNDNRSFPSEGKKKVTGMMKDEIGGKIIRKFVALRAKMYAYRKLDGLAAQYEHREIEDKHCKETKSM